MARRSEGWSIRVDPRTRICVVRFRHAGRQFGRSTGTTDRAEAQVAAARIFAEVTSGVRRRGVAVRESLPQLAGEWLASLESSRSPETIEAYEGYVSAHWGRRWRRLDQITDIALADYMRARLRLVTASTVRKELSAMRGFLAWCVERQHLAEPPVVPSVPKRAVGTSASPQRRVDLTPAQVEAILEALPTAARRARGTLEDRHVRELYVVAWETGLRVGTLRRLEVPRHYRRGQSHLAISADVDKARWARDVPLSPRARETLDAIAPRSGLIFGPIVGRAALKAAARTVAEDRRSGLSIADAARVSDHDIRHAAITHLVSSPGTTLAGAAYLAGHTHVGTTSRYVHAGRTAAEQALAARIGAPNGAPKRKSTKRAKPSAKKSPTK